MTTKPDLTRVWASGAPVANVEDPDVTSPGKFSAGWAAEVPTYQNFNYLQRLMTQGLAHINETGISDWDPNTKYQVNGLSKGSDGLIYVSLSEQSNNNPISDDGSNWEKTKLISELSTSQLIESKRDYPVGTIVETTGFSESDGSGTGKWLATSTTGLTASQSPSDRNSAELVSGSGRLFTLVYPAPVDALGAVGDGVSDDTAVWAAYLASFGNRKCYGTEGKTYAISSTLDLPAVCVLHNASFVDINPVTNSRVLHSPNNVSARLNRVNVDRGGLNNAGSLLDSAGIWISGGSVKISNTEVTGDGFGNGVALDNPISASLFRVRVYESRAGDSSTTPAITDDVFQGIWINRGTDVNLLHCIVEDTKVEWNGQAQTSRYNRGFSFGGTKRFTLTNCTAKSLGQAFDFTGDQNSSQFTVSGCFAVDAYSWGFKAANTATKGKYIGCYAIRCDLGGFVASAPPIIVANPSGELTQDIQYIDCIAVDTGSVGNWSTSSSIHSFSSVVRCF